MTTRSGARVYRGVARRPPAGACPHQDGVECSGSGVNVQRDDVDDATVTAGLELAAQIPDPPTPPGRPRAPHADTPIPGDRAAKERCPECGRPTPRNGDGTLRGHYVRADDPDAPRCPGGKPRHPPLTPRRVHRSCPHCVRRATARCAKHLAQPTPDARNVSQPPPMRRTAPHDHPTRTLDPCPAPRNSPPTSPPTQRP